MVEVMHNFDFQIFLCIIPQLLEKIGDGVLIMENMQLLVEGIPVTLTEVSQIMDF